MISGSSIRALYQIERPNKKSRSKYAQALLVMYRVRHEFFTQELQLKFDRGVQAERQLAETTTLLKVNNV